MAGAPMLTVVDLVIVAVVVLAAMHGWRLGLSGFAFGLAGLVAGGLVGLWIAGWLIGTHWSPPVLSFPSNRGGFFIMVGSAGGGQAFDSWRWFRSR